jgi:hypothetical protein
VIEPLRRLEHVTGQLGLEGAISDALGQPGLPLALPPVPFFVYGIAALFGPGGGGQINTFLAKVHR